MAKFVVNTDRQQKRLDKKAAEKQKAIERRNQQKKKEQTRADTEKSE